MRILSLNAWHGARSSELREFLVAHLDATEVFCFQEASGPALDSLFDELFLEVEYSHEVAIKLADDGTRYCLRTFIKKPLRATNSQTLLSGTDASVGQALAVTIERGDKPQVTVINVHGVPFPGHKLDTGGRLLQSEQIIDFVAAKKQPAVICGDFNLLPQTESVKQYAAAGFQDMIKDYAIATTRNELAWEKYPGNKQLFADYMFVSPGLEVLNFSVPTVDASDHLPMLVEVA